MPTITEWRARFRLPGGDLECTVRRSSRARYMRVTIDPRHAAVVTVPARLTRARGEAERLAAEFLADRETWLRRHLARQARQHAALDSLGPLGHGAEIWFRGERHRIRVEHALPGRRTTVSRVGGDEGDELVVAASAREHRELADVLETWLRERARSAIHREMERHAASLGVNPAAVTIRDTRSRWGSCSRTGRLSFSWRLVLAPPEALETVVVHELAHLRVFGHGPDFWNLVASRRPDHRRWRRWLREHSVELHGMLGHQN